MSSNIFCATININLSAIKTLEKTQGRLVKSALGLPKYCSNTPLLKALGIRTIQVVNNNQLSIMQNALWNTSRARNFYMCMLKKYERASLPINTIASYLAVKTFVILNVFLRLGIYLTALKQINGRRK